MPTYEPASPRDDLSQLHRLEAAVSDAFNSKDVDALMAVYASGKALFVFDVMGPPGSYLSWDAYREALQHFFESISGPLHYTMSDLEIEASGDVAYSRSLQHLSGVHTKNGIPFDYTVRVTDVYRKFDSEWLIVQEHVSLPLARGSFSPLLHSSLLNANQS